MQLPADDIHVQFLHSTQKTTFVVLTSVGAGRSSLKPERQLVI